MGYSYERGAAARNLLRARAHGHERVISDAETLAWEFLGSDYGENGDVEMEEYISSRHGDFTPEAPVITDAMVERATKALRDHSEVIHPHEFNEYAVCAECGWAFGWQGPTSPVGDTRLVDHAARMALEAAFNTREN